MNKFRNLMVKLGERKWFSGIGRRLVPLDVRLQRLTGGRISVAAMIGQPALLLTTTGRRSGQPRSVPLLYTPYGDQLVVTASNWGQPHHPAWSANLLANPEAVATLRSRKVAVRARMVTGRERERVWAEITRLWPAYDLYASRTGGREIRLFLLSRNAQN